MYIKMEITKPKKTILFADKTAEQLSSICGKEIKLLQGTIKYYQERQVNTFYVSIFSFDVRKVITKCIIGTGI